MTLQLIKMILPIILTLGLGFLSRKRQWINADGAAALRTIVSKITLPAVLLNAFIFTDYSGDFLLVGGITFVWLCLSLGVGFLLKRFIPKYGKYMPFLVSGDEVGMLGYALMMLLFPKDGSRNMSFFDLGHMVFVFGLMIPLIQVIDGGKPDVKSIIRSIFSSLPLDAMLLGIILGLLGCGRYLQSGPVGEVYQTVSDFLTGPTTFMILIAIGYELSFKKEVMGAVVRTYAIRLLAMTAFGALSAVIIRQLIPVRKPLMTALLLMITLPPSYSVAIFGEMEGHRDFVSTTLSFGTLVSLILFVGVSVYALH